MKKVYTAQDPLVIYHLKNVLENNEIACLLTNTTLIGAVGELPPQECWPQLWILDERQLSQAVSLISEALRPHVRGAPWKCVRCNELIEAQFTECWQCGASCSETST